MGHADGFHLIFRYSSEVVKVEVCQLVLNECLQTLILPALQKLSVQIPLYTVIHQIHVHLDGNFFVCDRGIGDSYLLQIAEIGIAIIFFLAELVDQFFCLLQQGLILGEGLGQLLDSLNAECNICRDFFFRVCMVEEGLQQRMDFLPLCCILELLGDILHRLSIVLSVAHTGAVKFPHEVQYLGGQYRVEVGCFFFLRWFLSGRHREYGRVLCGGNRHLRSVGHLLNPVPNLLGHFLVVNLHRAIRRNMGNRAVVPIHFFQPVPNGQPISQMPES